MEQGARRAAKEAAEAGAELKVRSFFLRQSLGGGGGAGVCIRLPCILATMCSSSVAYKRCSRPSRAGMKRVRFSHALYLWR